MFNHTFYLFSFKPWAIRLWIPKIATLQKVITKWQSQIGFKITLCWVLYKHVNTAAGPQILLSTGWRSYLLVINNRRKGRKEKNKLRNRGPLCVCWWESWTENTVCLHSVSAIIENDSDSWREVRRSTWCLWNTTCLTQRSWIFITEYRSTLPKAQVFQGAQWGLHQVLSERNIRSRWSINISRSCGSKNLTLEEQSTRSLLSKL